MALVGGTTYHIRTTNLSDTNVDTWLHVGLAYAGGISYLQGNDDDPDLPGSMASHIDFVAPGNGTYTILVHAASRWSIGACDITINGAPFQTGVWVGGEVIDVPVGTNRLETSELSDNTAAAAVWIGAIDADNRITESNENGGVGRMARLDVGVDTVKVVVGGWIDGPSYDGWGYTGLYVNDYTTDSDGDHLGDALEAEIGTCAHDSDAMCAAYGVPAKDTDRDGIPDDEEIFGKEAADDPLHPQLLRKWGANPRHKDMFVEADWSDLFYIWNPLTFSEMAFAAGVYNAIDTAAVLHNPDGDNGIALHFDVGYDYGGGTLAGNWGGANAIAISDVNLAYDSQFRPVRRGLFRYGLIRYAGPSGSGVGARFNMGGLGTHRAIDLAHEMGHTVNLEHWGHKNWGELNCKPNYLSIMNYGGPPVFSRGMVPASIDPSGFTEVGLLAGGDSIDFLRAKPWYFQVDDVTKSVDAVRDRLLEPRPTRGTLTDAAYQSCGAFSPGEQIQPEVTADLYDGSTPRLVKSGSRLFHFWLGADGRVRYRHALQNGPGSAGSCPESGTMGVGKCTTWSSAVDTPLTGLKGFHVISHHSGGLLFAAWNTDNSVTVKQATSVDGAGTISGWGSFVTVATSLAPPELARVSAAGNRYGLFTTWLSGSTTKYRWHDSATSATWTLRGNLPVDGAMTPSVTLLPPLGVTEGDAIRRPCGAFSDGATPPTVHFVCYDLGTSTWQDLSSTAFLDSDACGAYGDYPTPDLGGTTCTRGPQTLGPPSLVFHMARRPDGSILGVPPSMMDANPYGQFYLMFQDWGSDGERPVPKIYRSPRIDASTGNLSWFRFGPRSFFANEWAYSANNTTVSFLEDVTLGSLKAVRQTKIGNEDPWTNRPRRNRFYPFADGSIKTTLADGDDFKVMEFGLCKNLAGVVNCGTLFWGLE